MGTIQGQRNENMNMVKDLIDEGVGWNLAKLRERFQDDIVEKIRRTPVSIINDQDRFIWPYRSDEKYTIRIGYHLIRKGNTSNTQNVSWTGAGDNRTCVALYVPGLEQYGLVHKFSAAQGHR
ncbi:hypothetical protein Ahy_A09g046764 isoform D [Arachis hypogaea]|uniref:Uncharacterized protein n=1 Tax=Arachis hypogaea TaxID=3818 RepID=A0A445BQW0_ARAHY|nr:hypothetical protein Ahy_A09g046764 isoform D [Arachis hypogaea]